MSMYLLYKNGESSFHIDRYLCEKLFTALGWHGIRPFVAPRHLPKGLLGVFEAPQDISIDPEAAAEHGEVLRGAITHRQIVVRVFAHELAHFFHFHYARRSERALVRLYDAPYVGAYVRNILHGWAVCTACYVFFLHSRPPLSTSGNIILFGGIPAALLVGMALTLLPRYVEERSAEKLAKRLLAEHGELIASCIREDEACS